MLCLLVWMVSVWIWRVWLFLFNQHKYYSKTIFILSLLYIFTFSSLKNWFFQTVVLEKTLESALDRKDIKAVNPKGNQPWIFIGRTEAEAENPVLWPPDSKNWLIGKNPDTGKVWRWKEKKGVAEDVMGKIVSLTQWTWFWANSKLATWCEELTHWERPWCWERLKAEREGGDIGWDGWMPSLSQWTWVWANSGIQWRTGKPGMLQCVGSQRSRHNLKDSTTTAISSGDMELREIQRLPWAKHWQLINGRTKIPSPEWYDSVTCAISWNTFTFPPTPHLCL